MASSEPGATHPSHRRRTRSGSAIRVLVPALVLVLDLLAAPSASAAVACSFDAGTGVASITFADGDDVTIGRSGDDIVVSGATCTGATVTATETVHVAESVPDGDDLASLTIDLSGGPLAPGKTDEGDGSSEIELTLGDAYGWTLEQLIVVGSSSNDTIFVGPILPHSALSIDLNGDEGTLDWDVTGEPTLLSDPSIVVRGGAGDDELRGSFEDLSPTAYPLALDGGAGDDLLVGANADDQIDGGAGRDTIASLVQARIDLSSGVASGSGGTDVLSGVENIIGSWEQDWLTGDDGPNRIDGAGGPWDVIVGGGGDDQLIGGEGPIDTVDFSGAPGGVVVDVLAGTATGEGNDTLEGIEWVVGSPYDDHVISAPWIYWIHAGDGDDVVRPVAPNWVDGEGGADTLDLSDATGPVTYDIERHRLTIDGQRAGAEGFETVIGSRFADVILGTTGAERIVGGHGADELDGSHGADVLLGRRGRDVTHGGPGLDAVYGGRGNDRISGGGGVDTCIGGPGEDTLDLCEILKRPAA